MLNCQTDHKGLPPFVFPGKKQDFRNIALVVHYYRTANCMTFD